MQGVVGHCKDFVILMGRCEKGFQTVKRHDLMHFNRITKNCYGVRMSKLNLDYWILIV